MAPSSGPSTKLELTMVWYDVPLGNQKQNVSAPLIRSNFTTLNTWSNIDHLGVDNSTGNFGFHNHCTFPLISGSAHPTTDSTHTSVYCMQDASNVGLIDYSRGPSDAVPTPLTNLQSISTAIVLAPAATTNVLDFTGLSRAICNVYWTNTVTNLAAGQARVIWTGTAFILTNFTILQIGSVAAQVSGNILQLKNASGSITYSNFYWTMQMLRLS